MKLISILLLSIIPITCFISCKKSQNFLRDNTTPTSVGYAPVCTNGLQNVSLNPPVTLATTSGSATFIAAGSTFNTELQYFSKSAIKEINLYNTIGTGARTLVNTLPYASAFSDIKKLDTLLVPYTVPGGTSGTVIKLEYEVLNQNALNVLRTVYIKR